MTSTKSQEWHHVKANLLCIEEDDPLDKAFKHKKIKNVGDIFILSDRQMEGLQYMNDDNNPPTLEVVPLGYTSMLCVLTAFYFLWRHDNQTTEIDWVDVDSSDIDEFCLQAYDPSEPIQPV